VFLGVCGGGGGAASVTTDRSFEGDLLGVCVCVCVCVSVCLIMRDLETSTIRWPRSDLHCRSTKSKKCWDLNLLYSEHNKDALLLVLICSDSCESRE